MLYARYMNHELLAAHTSAELGAAIRAARQSKGIRQGDLAEILGVSRMTVSRMENGDAVSMDTAMRALSECGYAIVVAPKFTRVRADD